MSTTIYNGYKLPLMTLNELQAFSKQFRKKAQDKVCELVTSFLAHEIAEMVDDFQFLSIENYISKHVLYKREADKAYEQTEMEKRGYIIPHNEKVKLSWHAYPNRSIYSIAWRKAEQRYREIHATQTRDPEVDFDCKACFIPLEDKIVALFYSEQKELKQLWEDCEEVSCYGYWDNVDPDERCSESEWKKRAKDWQNALPGYEYPHENGVFYEFICGFPGRMAIPIEDVMMRIPTLEDRARRIAVERVMDRRFNEIKSSVSIEGYDGLGIYNQTRRWIHSPEGKAELDQEISLVLPFLVPLISEGHLVVTLDKLVKYKFALSTEDGV
ncbi:hypothetical protein [Paenibacillus polymyxa]|uniref:Uncharacterized protein n=1 Tax=Paenibacillus polymyxa (strain SC2) TaxID=886882 RepID=E3EJR7_PAEPS|nr:hypothetical protein [Paenibacillus polymyxa]ADO59665.1 hypothetical protein PPSC2_26795 [Paenibacillus polymyxa SC2]WPQ59508.1 hypothetical protein SKN87_28000 [Paenibacillus polymyxa]